MMFVDPENLPFCERMAIKGGWPASVSIKDIALAIYPDNERYRRLVMAEIIKACESGKLPFYGNIKGWKWGGKIYTQDGHLPTITANPYPLVRGHIVDEGDAMRTALYNEHAAYPSDCLISRENFKAYLVADGKWPLDEPSGHLGNWFGDRKSEVKQRRYRDLASLLISEIIDYYLVKALPDLRQEAAWAKVVGKEFSSEHIKSIAPNNREITLSDGTTLEKSNFAERYRKRFQTTKNKPA